jgi:hypothetical protein
LKSTEYMPGCVLCTWPRSIGALSRLINSHIFQHLFTEREDELTKCQLNLMADRERYGPGLELALRPHAPAPPRDHTSSYSSIPCSLGEEEDEEGPLDYEENLAKYGWKMEIPGDPLGLK